MWWAMIMKWIGAGIGAASEWEAGEAKQAVRRHNRDLLLQGAEMTREAKSTETRRMRESAQRLKAEQTAGYAKSGAVISEGTPLITVVEQAGKMERDILEQRRNYEIAARGMEHEAEMQEYYGKMEKRQGQVGAFQTLFNSGGGQGGFGDMFGGGGK